MHSVAIFQFQPTADMTTAGMEIVTMLSSNVCRSHWPWNGVELASEDARMVLVSAVLEARRNGPVTPVYLERIVTSEEQPLAAEQ